MSELNDWMTKQRSDNEGKRQADMAREAALLGHAGAQRERIARGENVSTREWTPKRSELSDFISREVSGIDPDAGAQPKAPVGDPAQEWAWRQTDRTLREGLAAEDPDAVQRFAGIVDQYNPNVGTGQRWDNGHEIDQNGDAL
jgi:hypothetical protein